MDKNTKMRETVLIFDLEADSSSRSDDFRWTQITVACALVLDANSCMADRIREHDGTQTYEAVENARYYRWWRDVSVDGKDPFHELLTLMDEATLIVAYNGLEYDFPLLKRHYAHNQARYLSHRIKTLDPFANIKALTQRWPKLDNLLIANSLPAKIANGLQAIKMWDDQRRDELEEYCKADVVLLAKLVLHDKITAPGIGRLPNSVFGVASALAAQRESAHVPVVESEAETTEPFVKVAKHEAHEAREAREMQETQETQKVDVKQARNILHQTARVMGGLCDDELFVLG
jgi:hypothetical protein